MISAHRVASYSALTALETVESGCTTTSPEGTRRGEAHTYRAPDLHRRYMRRFSQARSPAAYTDQTWRSRAYRVSRDIDRARQRRAAEEHSHGGNSLRAPENSAGTTMRPRTCPHCASRHLQLSVAQNCHYERHALPHTVGKLVASA